MGETQRSSGVLDSAYAEFFEPYRTIGELASIQVLSRAAARTYWEARFGRGSTRFFNLPEGAWIDSGQWSMFGDWEAALIEPQAGRAMIEQLTQRIGWAPKTPVAYCISRTQILETTWQVFETVWPAFLTAECDCPLLVPQSPGVAGVVLFLADGRIRVSKTARSDDSILMR